MRENVEGCKRGPGTVEAKATGQAGKSSATRSAARGLQRAGVPAPQAASKRRVPAIGTRGRSALRRVLPVRGSSVGAGTREELAAAGSLEAAERGAHRRAACTSFRAGPRSAAAASGAERRPGRRPGQQRVCRGSACYRRPLPSRPPQPHSRRGAGGRGAAAPAQTLEDARGRGPGPEGDGKR